MTARAKAAAAARNNADAMGVGLPVIIAWALETYGGVQVPTEVAVAAAGLLGSWGAKIKRAL